MKRQLENFTDSLKAKHQGYYNLVYGDNSISVYSIQESLLTPNSALLEYFVGDSSIFTFTITKDTFHVHQIKKDFPLEEWVQDMRCGIFSSFVQDTSTCGQLNAATANGMYTTNARRIYQKVFAHVDSLLPDSTELIIVPDGVLGYVPFDALLVEDPTEGQLANQYHYLLQDHTISYAYSATLQQEMKYRRHRKEPSKNLLAFAPSFGKEEDMTGDTALLATRYIDVANRRNWLSPLKYNVPEVHAIKSIIGGDIVTDTAATEKAFTKMASDYRILHLSTHGKANDQMGDYSFLAFHELDDSLENEWLYNRELYNLNLNADLVVLSACETGIGELQRGEGIISLARGFSYAGAKSIVTSLWSVNDNSTKVLMELFYQNLKDGMSKDNALRQAKLDYLDNHPSMGQEPFFWAAFIPIGDMSPVELSGEEEVLWWILGGLLVLGLGLWLYLREEV